MAEYKADGDVGAIDVRDVAHLARLRLTDDEAEEFQQQLQAIVVYVRKLNELTLDGIEPTSHAHCLRNVFRRDEPKDGLDRDSVLNNAPMCHEGQFAVPRIVE